MSKRDLLTLRITIILLGLSIIGLAALGLWWMLKKNEAAVIILSIGTCMTGLGLGLIGYALLASQRHLRKYGESILNADGGNVIMALFIFILLGIAGLITRGLIAAVQAGPQRDDDSPAP